MFIADDNVRECVEEEMVIRIETLPSPDDLESHDSGMSPARQKNLFKLMYYRIAFKQEHISCRWLEILILTLNIPTEYKLHS